MQLLPSQREFLAADALTSNHDTQAVLLTAPAGFDLSAAIETLYQRHDALRLRFACVDGEWQVEEAPLTAATISDSCVFETLPEDPKLQSGFIGERCAHYLRSLDITHGPVFRAVHFQSRAEQPGRLFLVAHHLVVDDVSWRVLLRDLDAAYRQTSTGGPSQRGKNSSYQQWAEALTAYATSEVLERERDYWHDNAATKIEPWPVSPLSKNATCYASVRSVPLQLSVADTKALLKDCTATYHTSINELLLSAVYVALREWSGRTRVRVTLEENGRESLFPQLDVSETVGCFTTRYPLVLNSEAPNLSTVIKSVKEQYRAVPHQGIGYGLLRYIAGDKSLKEADPPFLLFKYQGALNQVMHSVDPHRRRSHALSLSGAVAAGALRFKLEYSERQYSQETMQSLVDHLGESLHALIAHSREPEAGYYTPSDFPLATIEQSTLDEWQTTYAIEQLYPATAMQKGMFFHSLLDQAAYVTQLYSTIEGDVQLPLLRQAWQTVVDRHAMLRTIFVGTGEAQHQLVLKRALLFWQEEDLRGLSADEQNARFEEYRQKDRARGFSPLEAPLMRLSLFRLNQEQYRLLWSHHHSLIDGWAIRLVFGEVMQVYAALNEGVTPVLPPVAEYARYVEWLLKQDQEKASRYWQTYLANVEGVTRLPYEAPGSGHARIHETLEVSLSAADMAQLQVLAKRHHTTVNTLLQLAWGVVLKSYAGEKQVVFGAVLSGRFAEVAEVERMVGLTINSIPVVASFAGNESLAEPIRRLHSGFQQSQKYAYLPLTEIQKQSRLSKGTPLFESLLVFENFARDLTNAVADGAASIRIGEFGAHLQDTYPLVLSMFQGESLQVTCRYFGDLFGAATVRRMLDQFVDVLQQLPQCQTVTEIKLLSNDAEQQQLQEWNDTEREYGRERSIAAVFEEQVRERPEAIAVVIGEQSLTYAELNRRANQLGHYLRELGVGPELCVGVCVERSLEMIVGMLGILKAGGAYVPLDPGYPTERLAYMLRDAGVVVVLTQESLLDSLPSHWGQVVSLDSDWAEIATRSTADVVSEATGENLAYVMYTSGSTGEPKGTAIVQRAVVRLVKETDYAEFGPAETFVQMAPLTFDASTFEVWGSLLNGAQLVVLEPGTPTLEELGAALRRYEVSTLWLTAGLFHLVVDERPEELRGLKQLLAGGDVLSAAHVSKALQWLDGGSLINGYGPTENTTFSCCRRFYRADEIGEVVPIGRPIANTQAYVLDEHLGLLPVGGNGELYLGGDGLARSYHNRAELTAERFVPHPFARRAGERLYRTGDVVRYRANGEIEFVGRRDAQVKVRGFRIELGEIEAVLAQHEQVREAVAMVREAPHGDKQLVAYVVGEAEPGELRSYLKERLPKYMAPQAIVKLEQLPLTASGKVDRKALPSPERTGDDAAEVGYVAPRTAEEELLAGVWAEVLGVERVSVHDNFFERGGHSLLATQVISRIRALFQIDLPLRALFDTTTLAELAQLIVRARQEEAAGAGPAIERRSRETAPALSYAQQRLWFLDQFEPGSTVYNVPAAIRLTGELDRAALERSLTEIARRHEVLRTTYQSVGGQPVQQIAPPSAVDLPLIELQGLKEEDKGSAVRELAAAEAARPFDLAHGPLWRAALVRLSEQEHVLLVTMYHIVTDGWSVGVLIRELTTLYEAYSRAPLESLASPLPELQIQYADFAEWQREWLSGPVLEEQMSYWREQLAGSSGVLELPVDHPRSATQSYRGATQTIQFGEELTRGLRELSRREGVTLFMTLLSGWQTLLARYSGQWDLNIGTPIANRTRSEVEELIGFFVNTLVLRTELQPRMSFREHLLRVREVCLGAYAHQDVPFEMVVEELQPERDMSRSPLFQVMFVLQNAPLGELQLPGLKLEPLEVEQQTAKFELTLTLMETETGLVGWCNYRTELFDEPTITRLLQHWRVLLQAAVEDPTQPLTELPLLTEAEREQVLVQWNETDAEYPRESCIHELFEQQVQQTPAATAVHFDGEQLSYRELNARANQLAHYLREQGVGAGEPVGLCVERSLEMVIGILGVLKTGGGYVPIDPDYPRERVAQMLSDSGIRLLLTQQQLEQHLPEHSAQVVRLDSDWREIAQYPLTNPAQVTTAENLAYMIYTSGSTGQPKGVMVPHRALHNHMAWMQRRFPLAPTDRVIQKTPFSFDASVWELFAPLLVGARLVIAAPGGHQDVSYLVRFIREQQITALKIVPSLLEPLLQEPRIEECASLRYVFCGAEAMPPRLPEKFVQRLDAELFNLYGPTETAIDVTYWKCETGTGRRSIPIGWPITNTQVYVLDEGMRVAPVGAAGELYVGGESLAHGYWQRPELTAERFVPNPYSNTSGARLYRTGDVVRWNGSGELEYLGRNDQQIKIRGFRIELGEIEAVLAQHEQVREAVAMVREAQHGDKQLVAYVVGEASVGELQRYLKEKLPKYMAPQAIVKLEQLPLTASGKIDRKALPSPERTGDEAAEVGYVAPRTAEEELLAGVWAEVLGIERVSVHDNFFERGGHSLLATQVISRIRALFHIDLPLRALFDTTTLAELAQLIVRARQEEAAGAGPAIERRSRETAPALSYAQQRLWFLDQFEPGSTVYNVPAAIRLTGELDRAALERSLTEIARRHEVLRTTYPSVAGQPVQHIAPPAPVNLPLIELQGLREEDKGLAVRELAATEAARPFDLAHGPLWRAALVRLSEQEHVLLVTMYHIVTDGWSVGVLIRELTTLYEAYSRAPLESLASPLPELTIQYADFAEWQREWLSGPVLEEQMSYWREQLAGSSGVLELPVDHARSATQSYRGATQTIQFSEELTRGLRELSRREGVTLFMTLLSGWQTLLARYSGQWDLNIGTPIANRTRSEVEELIGFFVNTLVLRTELQPRMSFREHLLRVREVCLGAYAHQDVPFEMVVEELQPERDMSRSPLFQVMFVLQNAPLGELQLPGLKLEPLEVEQQTAKFELTLTLMETDTGLMGWCNYRTELFDQTTIERLLEHWRVLLQAALEDPTQPLSELPLLTEAEREQVLVQWNETDAEYPRETCIHELFEQQVAQTPAATAVHFKGEQLSYRELNARANQLAHYLREQGVGAGEPVGLCVERSLEMVIGILGVLKAGGGYVPIDPDYPRERVAQMLSDSGIRLLLTQQHLNEQLPEHSAQVVNLDSDWQEIAQHPLTNPPTVTTAENLAYMIYTSGSTGQPKGVMNTHRGICNRLFWMHDAYRLSPDDRVLQKTPFSFDVSVWELFWPLLTGARLVMAEPGGHQNPAYLRQIIEQEQITVMHFVPAMLQVFLDEPDLQRCTSLRIVICSGEALSFDLQQKFFAHCGAALHNLYGPTEAAVDVTYWACDPDSNRKVVPIGKPIANTQIYLLDQNYEPVPIGAAGELHIGGVNLARGYHEKPGLTAEKFVPDPFSREPGARLYKSGDLSRYLPDGAIEFLGRIDHQVKLRGFRIELGEIETVLRQHASVNEALVVMQNIRDREQRLVAYVQLQAGAQGTASELRTYLKERLPEYMVPPVIVELEQWPLMPNGKVDRKALPAPEQTGEAIAEYVAPRTPEEELLAGIWAEVLEVERLSVHDDFFARGGHSLLATQVIARMREVFHVDVPLRSMFENPTVAQLSAALKKGLFNHARDIHPIGRASRNEALPLSFAQERLWFWEQLQPGTPTYNLTSAFRIDGDLDVSILEQSLNEIIRRHEILRTSYAAVEGEPVQIVAPHSFVPLTVTDLSDLPASERDFEVRRLAGEQALRPFDLTKAPLLRVSLLRLNAQEHVAVVSMHHIVSDAWSLGVLVEEIAVLYQEFLNGNTSPLPELPVQYADFAKWQREWLKGDVLTEQLAYWKEQLRDAPLLQLRTDRPRPQVYSSKGSIVPLNIPGELLRELKALSRKNNVTLFMTLLAAFNVLLHRHTGQDDIVVGTDIANRTRVETEKLIGFFVNMLVLRTSLKDDPTFTELLRRVREVTLGAYSHQDVPFAKLVDEFHLRRELTRNPLFQVVFVLQNAPVKDLELSGLTLTPVDLDVKSAPFDLVFVLSEAADTLVGAVTYSTELFDRQTVEQLIGHYQNVLEGVVAEPDRALSSLPILQDSEIDSHAIANFEVKLSRKDLEDVLFELSQASHS